MINYSNTILMKKLIYSFFCLLMASAVFAENTSTTESVVLPDVGNGSLRVVGNNLQNYFYNWEGTTRSSCDNATCFADKTSKIVDMINFTQADIYAFNELEVNDIVLHHLADAVNTENGTDVWTYVTDPYSDNDANKTYIKSGFLYRSDRVRTVGSSNWASSQSYYQRTMRVQVFEQISTGEQFTLSINHFKAMSDAESVSKRVKNATDLITYLPSRASDPDILILGDLNAQMDEECISIILNAGYDEQLLRFDASSYSYCYHWEGELIDHVFANASMAKQVTGAAVLHMNTDCESYLNSRWHYSDHDPYLVALDLGNKGGGTTPGGGGGGDNTGNTGNCTPLNLTWLETGADDWGEMTTDDETVWQYTSSWGAKAQKQGGYTGHLLTPAQDLSGTETVTLAFQHAHRFAGTPENELTLWVTADYKGSVDASDWQQLTISPYTQNTTWAFSDVTIEVPVEKVGANTVFAFRYMSTDDAYATWEVKNLTLTTTCASVEEPEEPENPQDAVEDIHAVQPQNTVKVLENGHIYIIRDGIRYNLLGGKID